ncbi:MAG: HAD hydrolase family protein, partial [bacterium]|nr:HAD hydrolase family protein [bacterium]
DTLLIHKAFTELGIADVSIQGTFPNAHILHWMEGKHGLDFKKRLAWYRGYSKKIDHAGIPSTEVIGFLSPTHADDIISLLKAKLGSKYSIVKATSPIDHHTIWVEVFDKGVNKASACDAIRDKLEVPKNRTAAIGNDWNDLDMLHWAERAYVCSNAPKALLGEFIRLPSNEENAVAIAADLWAELI